MTQPEIAEYGVTDPVEPVIVICSVGDGPIPIKCDGPRCEQQTADPDKSQWWFFSDGDGSYWFCDGICFETWVKTEFDLR